MIESFLITIPKDTIIYRGISDKNKTTGNWFAYSEKDASTYGSNTGSFRIKKDLKLINLISGFFHIDYMDKLNLKYTGTNFNGSDPRKMIALFPIGLPKMETQTHVFKKIIKHDLEENTNKDLKLLSSYIYDLTRLSDFNFDKNFADVMMEIYGDKCDGFTNPIQWPNTFDESMFHREIYLKDSDSVEFIKNIDSKNSSGGGIKTIKPIHFFKSEEDFKNKMNDFQEKLNTSMKDIPTISGNHTAQKNTTRKIRNK
jgi:hypothetical protein